MHLHILPPFISNWLNPRHHFLFGNQMINPLQQPKQTLHAPTPLIQHFISISRLRKTHQSRRPIDFRIDRLRSYKLTDIRLRLIFIQIEQLRQAAHLDPSVVLGNDPDVMFNDTLPEILPARMGFGVFRRDGWRRGENVCGAEVGPKLFGNDWPAHKFGDREEFQKLRFKGNKAVAGVDVYAMEKIGLLVVIRRQDDVIDDSLKSLN